MSTLSTISCMYCPTSGCSDQAFNMIEGHRVNVNAHTVLYASYPKVAECPQATISTWLVYSIGTNITISQGKHGSYQEPKQRLDEDDDEQALSIYDEIPEAVGKLQALSMDDEIPEVVGKLRAFSIGTPHAETGVREICELIKSGKEFVVLTPISLIPQIARGFKEEGKDEAVAEKVNHMTKIGIASTADAWLIHTPGMMRRHETLTAEQLT
jgi:hypothetical protein